MKKKGKIFAHFFFFFLFFFIFTNLPLPGHMIFKFTFDITWKLLLARKIIANG